MEEKVDIAYLYARVCGSFSTMRFGEKAAELMRTSGGITALWKVLFGEDAPDKPETRLVSEAEQRVVKTSIDDFVRLAKSFSDSNKFINALIAKYEIGLIKTMLFRLRAGETPPEDITYSSKVIQQAIARWPRITDMFAGTPYAWLDDDWLNDIAQAENRLDQQYYQNLWKEASAIRKSKVGAILDLLRWEIIYQNVVWAFRVRRYYGKSKEETLDMLVKIPGVDVTSYALQTFDYDLGSVASFNNWPLKRLLENQKGPAVDVPALEPSTLEDLFAKMKHSLRLYPFSYTPIYCYFKLLDYETSLLLEALESTRINIPLEQKANYVWIPGGQTA